MTTATPGALRGWHVLAMLLSFFALVIAVNIGFAIAAVQTFPGEDATHPYIQGLKYNEFAATRRAQLAHGWRAEADLHRAPEGAEVEVRLRDRAGAPLTGAHVEGELRWPTDSHHDHTLTFTDAGNGRYVARVDHLAGGRWQLRAQAAKARAALDFEADLTWPTAH